MQNHLAPCQEKKKLIVCLCAAFLSISGLSIPTQLWMFAEQAG